MVTCVPLPSIQCLSPIYVITDTVTPISGFLTRLQQALEAGVRLIQLRLPDLDETQYSTLAKPAITICRRVNARLLLNCAPTLAARLEADGVHLSARLLRACTRRPLPHAQWVAASCHNADELAAAQRIGANFVVLSPVLPTTSHPTARPLGWKAFGDLVAHTNTPVYALGGMTPAHLPIAQYHGAQGIAVLSAIWNAPDMAEIVRASQDRLVQGLSSLPPSTVST